MSDMKITVNVDEYLAINKYEVDESNAHIELVDDPSDAEFDKADKLIDKLQLNNEELATLNCYVNGMKQSQAALTLGLTIYAIKYKRIRIRQKYAMYIGNL